MPKMLIAGQVVEIRRLMLTARDIADVLSVPIGSARHLFAEGELENISADRLERVDVDDFAQWLERQVESDAYPAQSLVRLRDLVVTPPDLS